MADQAVVHIGENSPEEVAYRLLHDVARAEKKLFGGGSIAATTDRKWLLDTYAECLNAVQRPDVRVKLG